MAGCTTKRGMDYMLHIRWYFMWGCRHAVRPLGGEARRRPIAAAVAGAQVGNDDTNDHDEEDGLLEETRGGGGGGGLEDDAAGAGAGVFIDFRHVELISGDSRLCRAHEA